MIATIGYEKADLEYFVGTLEAASIEILVDIRDRAQSRRKGFSKTALSERLNQSGIKYIHFKELGDPKEGREAARSGDMKKFKTIFSKVMETDAAKIALSKIVDLEKNNSICLMCYERDHRECHRAIVSKHIEKLCFSKTMHLGVQSIEPSKSPKGRVLHSNQSAAA